MAKKRAVKRKKVNPVLPRGKWINAKIRVTKNGKIEARVSRSVVNPASFSPTDKYRGIITAKAGEFLRGGKKKVVSSWFGSRQEAQDWLYAMAQPHTGSVKVEKK